MKLIRRKDVRNLLREVEAMVDGLGGYDYMSRNEQEDFEREVRDHFNSDDFEDGHLIEAALEVFEARKVQVEVNKENS